MEEQLDIIIGFLKDPKLEVQCQAIEIISGLSADPANLPLLEQKNVVKELAKLLHQDKVCHQANMCLLTLSQYEPLTQQMAECKLLQTLLEIIFNVMKCITPEELTINKQILIQEENQVKTALPMTTALSTTTANSDNEMASKTLYINKNETLKETEVISVINQENLRFSILNISNMLVYSQEAKNEVLEGDSTANFKANNFHILLNWYPKFFSLLTPQVPKQQHREPILRLRLRDHDPNSRPPDPTFHGLLPKPARTQTKKISPPRKPQNPPEHNKGDPKPGIRARRPRFHAQIHVFPSHRITHVRNPKQVPIHCSKKF